MTQTTAQMAAQAASGQQSAQWPSTYQSSSQSSHTDSSGRTFTETITSDPSGTTVHRTTQEPGQPPHTETTRIAPGGQVRTGVAAATAAGSSRVEDVTGPVEESEADKTYRERMEDEYAKREGGA